MRSLCAFNFYISLIYFAKLGNSTIKDDSRFNLLYFQVKSQFWEIKSVFKHQILQMFGLNLNKCE